jgi:WD40 repeat protein
MVATPSTLPGSAPSAADPLAWLGEPGSAIAELAFGRVSHNADLTRGRHLALLSVETLELDLTDPAQRQFGDYELLELIGEGGMGVVYRAHQTSLDREVAVKLLAAGPWASEDFIERFRREAQNAARMQHPNIVAIYEVGNAEGLHFFSMRLVRGSSLADALRKDGPFTAMSAAHLMRTIAEALAYAHSLGVLHLDLKPANVLIDEHGTPHVADFGLARRIDSALALDNEEVSGTPAYMAPEQALARSQKITPATDIWGLGAILYQLVTGQPPFLAESAQATLKLVVDGTLRHPRDLMSTLPRDLEAIILKCLAREAPARYAGARALADDLGRFVEGHVVSARPLSAPQRVLRWTRREPKLAVTVACAVAALIAGLAATTQQWRRADSNAHAAAASAMLANDRLWQARIDQAQVAVHGGHTYDALPGLAANIREREAQGVDAREDRIRIGAVERAAPRLIDAIATGANISGIALSPDGAHVAVATDDQKLRLFDTATGRQRWQTSFAGVTHFQVEPAATIFLELLRYSADGRYLIGRNHLGIPTIQPTGTDEVLFDAKDGKVLVPPARMVPKFRDATYSPDGEFALINTTDHQAALVRTSDWQALGAYRVINRSAGPLWLVTARARHVLSSVAGFNVLDIRDPRTLAVQHSIQYTSADSMSTWASSPDGETALIGHQDGQLDLVDCNSGRYKTRSPSTGGRIGGVAFSPDGRWFGAVSDSGEVLVWDAATGKLAAPVMHLNITPESHHEQLFIDATARTVIASADMEMGLWYLPDATTNPVLLSGEFPYVATWWMRAFAYRPARGLIASDGGDGNLFLWRVQQLAPRGLRSAAIPPDQLHVIHGHVVAVNGASIRVANAADGRAVGPELTLPQPPAFAELTANNASLVAVAGHKLYVYDAATWRLRRAPIVLPDDPARIMLSPDARHALLLFADYHNGHNREIGQIWDFLAGKPITPTVGFESLTRFRYSADARGLLLWQSDQLQWLDALSLRPRWAPVAFDRLLAGALPAARGATAAKIAVEVMDAQIAADGSQIDVLTANDDGASRLWRLDAATGKVIQHNLLSETGGGDTFAMVPGRDGVIVQRAGDDPPLWWDQRHGSKELAGYGKSELGALALSPDTTMFARAPGQDRVVFTSTRDLQWLSPLLPTGVPALDAYREHPTQLAFTPDGNGLIARMRQREWLYWDIRPDLRPVDLIAREAALLNPDETRLKHGLALPLPDSERQALRADDPGTPLYLGAFPAESPTPRQPDLPPRLFDLTSYFNAPLRGFAGHNYTAAAYHELTPGVHRFLGVDYDVRGIIALAEPSFAGQLNPDRKPPQVVHGIHPGIERFAALDLLMASYDCEGSNKDSNAIVELDYADGSRARLPLMCGEDFVANYADDDAAKSSGMIKRDGGIAPAAWRATNIGTPAADHWTSAISAARVVNPYPEREVTSIALEATDVAFSSPFFFAITAEPVGTVPAVPANPAPARPARNLE